MLGLDRRCTRAQIRAAYRLLAKQHHPDVNSGSREAVARLQELNAAYEVLGDADRRAAYDRRLRAAAEQLSAPLAKAQRNIAQATRLRIEDFLRGVTIVVRVNDPAAVDGAEVYRLTIPAGTAPGSRFRIPRTGGGVVTVRVGVLPGFRFKARGSDLCGDLRISAQRAKCGGVETIVGPGGATLRVSIPAGVGRGEVVRLRGEGLPKAHGGRGDLLVRLVHRPEVRIARR